MRKLSSIAFLVAIFLLAGVAHGQQFDVGVGVSALKAPSAFDASSDFFPQSIGGGAFPVFSADFLIKHQFGFGGEVFWRAKRNVSQDFLPFRPIFYDFNAVWAPKLGRTAQAELQAGLGGESVRFYQPFANCNFFSCTDFTSTNHFMGHFGGGLRFYFWHNVFIRPEVHLYLVHNNFEFSGAHAVRIGASIGYSLKSY